MKWLVVGLLVVIAAGCGGGSSTTVTVSAPASSQGPSSPTTQAAEPSKRHQFEAFLAAVKPIRHQSNAEEDVANHQS